MTYLRYANLALLILFPIAWFAPLMRAGLLPLFGLSEISVISGLQSLWRTDVFLALLVTVFALFAPYMKTIGLALVQFRLAVAAIFAGTACAGQAGDGRYISDRALYRRGQGRWHGPGRNRLGAVFIHRSASSPRWRFRLLTGRKR